MLISDKLISSNWTTFPLPTPPLPVDWVISYEIWAFISSSLHCLIDFCSEDVMVSVKIINTHNPALYIYYLFPNIALRLIEAKRVKLEYMSNCLCHRFSVRCNFPCSSHPWKHLAMSRNIFSSIKSFLYLSVFGKWGVLVFFFLSFFIILVRYSFEGRHSPFKMAAGGFVLPEAWHTFDPKLACSGMV